MYNLETILNSSWNLFVISEAQKQSRGKNFHMVLIYMFSTAILATTDNLLVFEY